ncbi:MAG: MBOAT family protein [Magnetococcales bacterium]|nr:MBOAT family protein [Magnetococcales bacterium]NGZ27870.1 MBOAT family protein [Magnetococcales bacterium]
MSFQSIDYILFLLAVVPVYWMLGLRVQNVMLLLVSYFFYGYLHPWFLVVIVTSTLFTYGFGTVIAKAVKPKRKYFLVAGVTGNLLMLAFFKYHEQLLSLWWAIAPRQETNGVVFNILLPMGLSFFTFQNIGYLIDLHRKRITSKANLLEFAIFVAFFPKLIAGPIERANAFLPQTINERRFSPEGVRDGVYLMVLGFFKKLVIADNTAVIAGKISLAAEPDFYLLWAGLFAMAVQYYADFSGYTDIARGSARLFGFKLSQNFNHPFFAVNPADFWNRWHMTLTLWFRDYLFFPLYAALAKQTQLVGVQIGGSVLVTFLLMGLWHGTGWNMVAYGVYHGVLMLTYVIVGRAVQTISPGFQLTNLLRVPMMFFFFMLGLLIFREPEPAVLIQMLSLSPGGASESEFVVASYLWGQAFYYSLPLWLQPLVEKWRQRMVQGWIVGFDTVVAGVLFLSILTMRSLHPSDFVYHQF